jgi:hypothetical protein
VEYTYAAAGTYTIIGYPVASACLKQGEVTVTVPIAIPPQGA